MSPSLYTILIIDDRSTDRKIYRRFLERSPDLNFKIEEATNGEEGLELCQSISPDCIILDFKLPDQDGLQLIPQLQKITSASIIFITGQPEALVVTEAYRKGVAKYISKESITSELLLEAVKEACTAGVIYEP